jgi:hypothetical protein
VYGLYQFGKSSRGRWETAPSLSTPGRPASFSPNARAKLRRSTSVVDLERQHSPGAEPRVHLLQGPRGADHEAGADQQDEPQRHLAHDQGGPQTLAAGRGRAPARFGKRARGVRPRREEAGRQPEDEAGEQRDEGHEAQHRTVERHRVRQGEAGRAQLEEQRQAPPADGQARRAAEDGQQQALRRELPRDPPGSGPERLADRDLLPPLARPGQQQVAHVDAGDQEHEPDAGEEGEQGRARAAHGVFVQGPDLELQAVPLELSELRAEPPGDRPRLPPGRVDRDAAPQPAEDAQVVEVAGGGVDPLRERHPRVDVFGHARVGGEHEAEPRRHHAHHRRRSALEPDRLPDGGGVAAEAPLPQAVAQEDRAAVAPPLPGKERPAQGRSGAEDAEEVARVEAHLELLGLAAAGQGAAAHPDPGEAGKGPAARRDLAQLEGGPGGAAGAHPAEVGPDEDEPPGVVVGQRPDQHGVDDAEDGRRGADPQGQRQDRRRREPPRLRQHPRGEEDVSPEVFRHPPEPGVADGLLHALGAPELQARRPSGRACVDPVPLVAVGEEVEMRPELLVHLALELPAMEKGPQVVAPPGEPGQRRHLEGASSTRAMARAASPQLVCSRRSCRRPAGVSR